MGRRKKAENSTPASDIEVKITDTSKINYSGKVTVKVLKGNKVYSSHTFKNAGRWPLFQFFTFCLMGDYNKADAMRPQYIRGFYYVGNNQESNQTPIPVINETTHLDDYFNIQTSSFVNALPYVEPALASKEGQDGIGFGSSKIKYKFTVPFINLLSLSNQIRNINALCLYATQNKDILNNPSAFVFISENDHLADLIDNISNYSISNINEYSLYIEWELQVENPTK